ncbi:hypothetical protein DGWBC_1546 [Dehalogenimonas sp. WBC-2]|nr:hypothetical protein DGWBC_1546 [Dehalogenimonas sp. WBC-2]
MCGASWLSGFFLSQPAVYPISALSLNGVQYIFSFQGTNFDVSEHIRLRVQGCFPQK